MKTISVRLSVEDFELLNRITDQTGERSASDAIRRLIRTWTPPRDPGTSFVSETQCLASASHIRDLLENGKPVEPTLRRVAMAYRRHVIEHGWLLPPVKASLLEVLNDLRGGGQRLASAYLHAVFPSFWYAADGPAISAAREGVLEKVLAYRVGLNSTGEVFDIDWAEVRRAFTVQRKVVSFFQPSLATSLYARFCPASGRVWDPSGGFGARMLGFAAAIESGTYFVNEPAAMTAEDLERLAAGLGHLEKKVVLYRAGSEYGHPMIEDASIDLVLTSPPYFQKEHYFREEGQAGNYKKETDWVKHYLIPTMVNAFRYLQPNGHLVLITDKSEPYCRTATAVGFDLVSNEELPTRRDHFQRAFSPGSTPSEKLLVWRKK